MSLLDDNFDVDSISILKNKIEKYIRDNIYRWSDSPEYGIAFVQCNWSKIISNLDKYYIYVNAIDSTLHVRIDKISKSLPGEFGGPNGAYVLIYDKGKKRPLKTVLGL
jgi:hypothetical protein